MIKRKPFLKNGATHNALCFLSTKLISSFFFLKFYRRDDISESGKY